MRGLTLEGTFNFRDLGGLPLTGGGTTAFGAVYRSDALSGLTPRGVTSLEQSAVGLIVDLRTREERELAPDRLPTSRRLRTIDLPLLEGAVADLAPEAPGSAMAGDPPAAARPVRAAGAASLGTMYLGMLDSGASSFAQIARLIGATSTATPAGVLIHCTAGKDRTGVASALILDAVGVTREAIVADYVSSQSNLAGPWAQSMFARAAQFGIPVTRQVRELIAEAPADAITQALSWVDARGGSSAYLRSAGLSPSELRGLRSRLVDEERGAHPVA